MGVFVVESYTTAKRYSSFSTAIHVSAGAEGCGGYIIFGVQLSDITHSSLFAYACAKVIIYR
ncbi:hypothetical protein D0911_09445 [Zhongshania marina]|uniref:Uncharacterized protein n=1 Tax=Zhongshania marina TaxID=2304603 RepID=A0ABX9W2B7_9GAMM|nr:hypothetical protein D0911_09445 [Zhongshania marina]